MQISDGSGKQYSQYKETQDSARKKEYERVANKINREHQPGFGLMGAYRSSREDKVDHNSSIHLKSGSGKKVFEENKKLINEHKLPGYGLIGKYNSRKRNTSQVSKKVRDDLKLLSSEHVRVEKAIQHGAKEVGGLEK